MTAPQIIQVPGIAEQLQPALTALMSALQERRQREQQQQEILLKRGALALEEEQAAEKRKADSEAKKQREQSAEALRQQLTALGQPSMGDALLGAIQSGDAQLASQIINAGEGAQGLQQTLAKRQKAAEIQQRYQGKTDPQSIAQMISEFIALDPDKMGASGISALAQLQEQGQPRMGAPHYIDVMIKGKPYVKEIFPDGRERIVGEKAVLERENRPVMGEREKVGAAFIAIPAQERLRKLDAADPTLANKVFAKVANAYGVGGFAQRLIGKVDDRVIESKLEATMTSKERLYYTSSKVLISGIIPGLGGKTVTGNELIIHGGSLFSTGSGDLANLQAKSAARDERISNLLFEAGPALKERLEKLGPGTLRGIDLSRYGVGADFAPSGGESAAPPTEDPLKRLEALVDSL